MDFHLATSRAFDFDMFVQRSQDDKGPRHTIHQISQYLSATIQQPDPSSVTPLDHVLSKMIGQPSHWALARRLAKQLRPDDVVYCTGEDVGIPLAILLKLRRDRPKLAISVMAPDRVRPRTLLQRLGLADCIQLFTVTDQYKANYLKNLLNLPDSQVYLLPEQTDARFFTPGEGTIPKSRPLIASAGLEQRDYLTLAQATTDQDVDIKICAFSPNASAGTRTKMPDPIPGNMEIRYFEFDELRDLYRTADMVVVNLLKNQYSAGLTVLMEAMACNRPVIMTRNIGFSSELMDQELVLGVEPGDVSGLKAAIAHVLNNPQEAKEMAQRAHDYFLNHNTSEHYVQFLSQRLQHLKTPNQELQSAPQMELS